MKPKLKRQKFANVWDALEDTPAQAANMTMRSDLLIALRQRIMTWKITQSPGGAPAARHAAAIERLVARQDQQIQPRCAGQTG